MQVEAHRLEVAEHPRGRRSEAGDGSGIDEPGTAALHSGDLFHRRYVGMSAANEVPVAGARHCVAVFRIVNEEDLSSVELEARVGAVVMEQPATCLRPIVQCEG